MEKILPYLILEVANVHGGDVDKIFSLLDQYANLNYPKLGIKFQPFKYDTMALEDYSWYEVYKELHITGEKWSKIFEYASDKVGDVWIDVGDTYAIENFKTNFPLIKGIKLQASALENYEVISLLKSIDLSSKEILANVSGYELEGIAEILSTLGELKAKEVIIQVGFQNMPTKIEDTLLSKIQVLKNEFPQYRVCYADHLDANLSFAQDFPVYAYLSGADIIEKHICMDRDNTKYDATAALEVEEIKQVIDKIKQIQKCFSQDFIVTNERKYLEGSRQVPVLRRSLNKGQLVSECDVIYRRTAQEGLTWHEIKELQENFNILNCDVEAHSTLKKVNFKKAKIGVVVAGRLKSSRLVRKAVLPIDNLPSVERCLESCLKLPLIDQVVLATSDLDEDSELENYTLGGRAGFWKGDPDDVINRFLGAAEKYDLDIVLRVTADCPIVSPEYASMLINSHFRGGYDYSGPDRTTGIVGTTVEVYTKETLERIISYVKNANYSEYMNAYVENNPSLFKVNVLKVPSELSRKYRLTLDYQKDLDMFNALYKKIAELDLEMNLKNVIKVLDEFPQIAQINQECQLVYQVNTELVEKIRKATTITV